MPDIIECPNCKRETYQGRATCPHCAGWLLDQPFSALAPDLPNVPDHGSFLALYRLGAYRLQIDYDELDLDQLIKAAGITGFRQLTMRLATVLERLANFLGFAIVPRGSMAADMERDLARYWLRKSRAKAVARAMADRADYYEDAVRSGMVAVRSL
jgi:hypothetical protein